MKKAKKNFEKDQYKALMRRFDHDANEVITKNEFCESILPNDVKTTDNLTAFKEIEFLDYFETPFKKTQELIYNKNNNDTLKRKYLISHAQPLHKDEDNIFNQSEYRPSALKYLKDYMVDQKNVIEIDKEIYIKQQSPLKFQTSLPEKQEINWKLNSNNAKSFKEILKSTPKKKIFEADKNMKGLDVQNLMESVTHYEKIETEKSMKNKSNFKYLMNYETKNIK